MKLEMADYRDGKVYGRTVRLRLAESDIERLGACGYLKPAILSTDEFAGADVMVIEVTRGRGFLRRFIGPNSAKSADRVMATHLRKRRRETRKTQSWLAGKLGISQKTVERMETGKRIRNGPALRMKAAEILGVDYGKAR